MRTKKFKALFALLVFALFCLMPICEAQAVAFRPANVNYAKRVNLASQAGVSVERIADELGIGYYQGMARPRKDALAAASFVKTGLDPITRENMGGVPPPVPPAVNIPIPVPDPIIPDVHPMSSKEIDKFVDKAMSALPYRKRAVDEVSNLVQTLNDERAFFDTPVDFSNVIEDDACVMPGVPGAEVSGPGLDMGIPSEYPGAAVPARPQRPSRTMFKGTPLGMATDAPRRGDGGGTDNSAGASFARAEERLHYLQTILDWGQEAYTNSAALAAGIVEFLEDAEVKEEYDQSDLDLLGTPDKWRKVADGMQMAFIGLHYTTYLYAEGIGVFRKITNAVLDRSGKGAGTLLYEYDGLRFYQEVAGIKPSEEFQAEKKALEALQRTYKENPYTGRELEKLKFRTNKMFEDAKNEIMNNLPPQFREMTQEERNELISTSTRNLENTENELLLAISAEKRRELIDKGYLKMSVDERPVIKDLDKLLAESGLGAEEQQKLRNRLNQAQKDFENAMADPTPIKDIEKALEQSGLSEKEKEKLRQKFKDAESYKEMAEKGFDKEMSDKLGGQIEKMRHKGGGKDYDGINAALRINSMIAGRTADIENLKHQLEQLKNSLGLSSSERRAKKKELERKLEQANQDLRNAEQGYDSKTEREYNAVQKELELMDKQIEEETDSALKAMLKSERHNLLKRKNELSQARLSQETGRRLIQKMNEWLLEKAKEKGFKGSDQRKIQSLKRLWGWQAQDNKIRNMIGSPSLEGEPGTATGLHASLEQLEETFATIKEFLDPEFAKEIGELLGENGEYTQRLKDLEKQMKELDEHTKESQESDKDISDKEDRNHKEMQRELLEEALDLAGDIAKTFKEILKKLAEMTAEELKVWWDKVVDRLGEIPGDPCYKDAPYGCSELCEPKAIYGKQDIIEAEMMGVTGPPSAGPGAGGQGGAAAGRGPTGGLVAITGFAVPPGGMGGSGPVPGPMGEGGTAQCVDREKCPSFPKPKKPEEGAPGGRRPKPGQIGKGGLKGYVPGANDLGRVAHGSGTSKGGGVKADGPYIENPSSNKVNPDPEDQNDAEKDAAEEKRIGLINNYADKLGLKPLGRPVKNAKGEVIIKREYAFVDPNGKIFEFDPDAGGFAPANTKEKRENARKAWEDAKRKRSMEIARYNKARKDYEQAVKNAKKINTDSVPGATPTPPSPGAVRDAQSRVDSTGKALDDAQNAVDNANNNVNRAEKTVSKLVSYPLPPDIKNNYEGLNREYNIHTLESVILRTDSQDPGDISDDEAATKFKAENERLRYRIDSIKSKYKDAPAHIINAKMQEAYESMIKRKALLPGEEGEAADKAINEINDMNKEISDKIKKLSDELTKTMGVINHNLKMANDVAKEYDENLEKLQSRHKLAKERLEAAERSHGIGTVDPKREAAAAREGMKMIIEDMKNFIKEANEKLDKYKKNAEEARDKVNKMRDDILDAYDKLANKKLNAPGLKEHLLDKDGKLTEFKGRQFMALKAAERNEFKKQFNNDALKAAQDLLSGLSKGVVVTGAGEGQPISLGDFNFPVRFNPVNGELEFIPLAVMLPGEASFALQRAVRRSDFSLEVTKNAPAFNDLMKVMEVKGNRWASAIKTRDYLKNIKRVYKDKGWPEEMDNAIFDEDGNVRKQWLGKGAKDNSLVSDYDTLKAGYESLKAAALQRYPGSIPKPTQQSPAGTGRPPMPGPAAVVDVTGATGAEEERAEAVSALEAYGRFWGNVGWFFGGLFSGLGEAGADMLDYDQGGKKISKFQEQKIHATLNYETVLDKDIANMNKVASHIQGDIYSEIRASGFKGYRLDALQWKAKQMSSSDFFKALKQHRKVLEAGIPDNLQKEVDDLRDEMGAKLREKEEELDRRLEICGDSKECQDRIKAENLKERQEIRKAYEEQIDRVYDEMAKVTGNEEIGAALKEIQGLKNQAEEQVIKDELELRKQKLWAAGSELRHAILEDESWGLKSISIWTEWSFEKKDVKYKEKTRELEENLNQGANILDNLRKQLNEKGHNLDALLKHYSWEQIKHSSDSSELKKWINNINNELGLTGKNRLDITQMCSECTEEQLQNFALYWDSFGNVFAKQVDGSYTHDDMARGYVMTGMMKHKGGDLESAFKDLQIAKNYGAFIDEKGKEQYSEHGFKAELNGNKVQKEMTERMISRLRKDICLDPFMWVSMGTLALGKAASTGKAVATAIIQSRKIASLVNKVVKVTRHAKTLGAAARGVPGLGRIADAGMSGGRIIGKGLGAVGRGGKIIFDKTLGKGLNLLKGGKKVRGQIRAGEEALDALNKQKNTAKAVGNVAEYNRLSSDARRLRYGLDALKDAQKQTGFWTRNLFKPKGQRPLDFLADGIKSMGDDLIKTGRLSDDGMDLVRQFRGAKSAQDAMRNAGGATNFLTRRFDILGGNAPKRALKHINTDINKIKNSFNVFNKAMRTGRGQKAAFNGLRAATRDIQNSQKVLDAYKYMGWGYRTQRSFGRFADAISQKLGVSVSDDVLKMRTSVQTHEMILRSAMRIGERQEIIRAWNDLNRAKRGLSTTTVLRGAAVGDKSSRTAKPGPASSAPERSADDLRNALINRGEEQVSRQIDDINDLPRKYGHKTVDDALADPKVNKAFSQEWTSKYSEMQGAQDALDVLKGKKPRVIPIKPPRKPVVIEVPAKKPLVKLTPAEVRAKMLKDFGIKEKEFSEALAEIGIKEEKFVTFKTKQWGDKFRPATKQQVDDMLRNTYSKLEPEELQRLGLSSKERAALRSVDDLPDDLRKSIADKYVKILGEERAGLTKPSEQFRYKKGAQWVKQEEVMIDAKINKLNKKFSELRAKETTKMTPEARTKLFAEQDELHKEMGALRAQRAELVAKPTEIPVVPKKAEVLVDPYIKRVMSDVMDQISPGMRAKLGDEGFDDLVRLVQKRGVVGKHEDIVDDVSRILKERGITPPDELDDMVRGFVEAPAGGKGMRSLLPGQVSAEEIAASKRALARGFRREAKTGGFETGEDITLVLGESLRGHVPAEKFESSVVIATREVLGDDVIRLQNKYNNILKEIRSTFEELDTVQKGSVREFELKLKLAGLKAYFQNLDAELDIAFLRKARAEYPKSIEQQMIELAISESNIEKLSLEQKLLEKTVTKAPASEIREIEEKIYKIRRKIKNLQDDKEFFTGTNQELSDAMLRYTKSDEALRAIEKGETVQINVKEISEIRKAVEVPLAPKVKVYRSHPKVVKHFNPDIEEVKVLLDDIDAELSEKIRIAYDDFLGDIEDPIFAEQLPLKRELRDAANKLSRRLNKELPFLGKSSFQGYVDSGAKIDDLLKDYFEVFRKGPRRLSELSKENRLTCMSQAYTMRESLKQIGIDGWEIYSDIDELGKVKAHVFLAKKFESSQGTLAVMIDPTEIIGNHGLIQNWDDFASVYKKLELETATLSY